MPEETVTAQPPTPPGSSRRRRWGWKLGLIVVGMLAFAFINVPLFRVFCTHLGIYVPADQKLAATTGPVSPREVTISFSGVQAKGMHIEFHPATSMQWVHVGQRAENKFVFVNNSGQTVHFRAIHDIYPYQAATHVALIQCFCFSNQTMKPHTSKELPVIYQVNRGLDPLVARISVMYSLEPLAPAPGGGAGSSAAGGQ